MPCVTLSSRDALEESALSLAQLVLAQDAASSLRQMSLCFFVMRAHRAVLDDVVLLCCCAFCGEHSAIIVLRKYVKEHWSPFFQQFRGDAPPPEVSFFPNLFLIWIAITERVTGWQHRRKTRFGGLSSKGCPTRIARSDPYVCVDPFNVFCLARLDQSEFFL